jgi:signal transduction histidine kinase
MHPGDCMLRRLPFRTKLILVVSVPLFALIGFAGLTIDGRFNALSTERQYGHVVTSFEALTRVGRAVADEGVASHWYVQTPSPNPPAAKSLILDTRNATDAAATALNQSLGSLNGQVSPATMTQVRDLANRLQGLQITTRAEVTLHGDPGGAFTDLATNSMNAAEAVARDVNDRGLSTSLLDLVDLRRAQLANATEASVVMHWLVGGTGDIAAWDAAVHDQQTNLNAFLTTATPAEVHTYETAIGSPVPDPLRSNVPGDLPAAFPATQIAPYDYMHSFLTKQSSIDRGVDAVQTLTDHSAISKQATARTQLELAAGGTAALIGLVLLLAWALVQAVNKPLRALTRAARNVSERRLPQLVDTVRAGGHISPDQLDALTPITVESNDEIGALAKAFANVQRVAVAVAEEQAALLRKGIGDLYVNLARRNQSLLDRQLALLDDLERDAGEPDELGSLFELDHLATRMRRNAESLLVLSGSDQPRQWRTPIPIVDVVRAAAAEIADFPRVRYVGFDGDLAVAGHAVADITHLLAELLENATAFSPPSNPVVVSGAPRDHRYLITITDEGIGVDDERLAQVNALLARPPAPGLALSRTLGLHVVAHLATRHGIYVQLRRAAPVGLTALVAIPAAILARSAPNTDPEPASPPPPSAAEPALVLDAFPVGGATPPHPPASDGPDRPSAPPRPAPPERPHPDPARQPAVAWTDPTPNDELPRRPIQAGNGETREPLIARVPGTNLSHRPAPPGQPTDKPRPRPERVHDLLTRHARGVRDGRAREDKP